MPEPPNHDTCHVTTPPEPEQAEIEVEPAATEWCHDKELEVGSVEKLEEEEKGVEKQDGMIDREAERHKLELVPSDMAIDPIRTVLTSAVDPDPKPAMLINPILSNIAPNPTHVTFQKLHLSALYPLTLQPCYTI